MSISGISQSEVEVLKEKLSSAKELIGWNRKLYSTFGLDPIDSNNVMYSITVVYVVIHTTMTGLSLPENFEYIDQTIDCTNEMIGLAMVMLKLLIYKRKAPMLAKLLNDVAAHFSVDQFESRDDAAIFLDYMTYAKGFFKLSFVASNVAATVYYLHVFILDGISIPMQTDSNNLTTYLPPYRIKFYVPLTNLTIYAVALVHMIPLIAIAAFSYISDGNMLVVLVTHACSQLSILSRCCLELLGDHPKEFSVSAAKAIRKNYYIMNFVRDINSIFSTLMLQQRVGAVLFLCLFSYGGLVDWRRGEKLGLIFTVIYVLGVTSIVFAYSYCGQCLIDESLYLNEALCKSSWYNLQSRDMKYYLILHTHVQKALYLDCGGFFVFSLNSFVTIVKSAVAYLSALRALT